MFLICTLPVLAAEPAASSPWHATPLSASQLDGGAFAEWCQGRERPVTELKEGPREVVWTRDRRVEWRGVEFGKDRSPGPRHLRIGFTQPCPMGTVLVRGGGRLSVLKPGAAYPGDLADETLWVAAQRPEAGPADREDYALWVLPPNTRTRALRLTHMAEPTDREPAGWLGGVWVLPERCVNVAPQAIVAASAREEVAERLVDQTNNRTWQTWDNGEKGAGVPLSPEHPETITLSWPHPVTLRGVCLLWAGCGAAEVEAFVGPDGQHPGLAPAASWRRVAASETIEAMYPLALGPNWLDFAGEVRTRALRLRMTRGPRSGHPHLADKVKEGRRVWLGELLALQPLGGAPLESLRAKAPAELPPPIPVKFTLPDAGLVTLVIEDLEGRRVRNLLSETPFPSGENTAWWDGSDDLGRDPGAARHGLYHIPTRFVAPGQYKVRGLWRKPLQLRYELSVYNAGNPPWETADKTGCWMTNHTPPTSMAFVPASRSRDGQPLLFMGAFVAEGGHGLQWIREDGTKLGGQGWIGGTWTGAPTLAVDNGPGAVAEHLCYAASMWEGELRLTAKSPEFQDKALFKTALGEDPAPQQIKDEKSRPAPLDFDGGDRRFVLGGIAAWDGTVVCALVRQNELMFVDARAGSLKSRISVESPRGMAFDGQGRLLVLSGAKLLRFKPGESPSAWIASGLEDPRHVALDAAGNVFISDRGRSHQVKQFSPDGKLVRAIGKPGVPAAGAYDQLRMNNPNGLAVDSRGRLWVAEDDFHPKRVSVWSPGGELLRAYYGPGEYGGGGVLDPVDKSRFFYKGLEFRLDWQSGRDELVRVFSRPDPMLEAHYGPYSPDTPLYPAARPGQRYFTSCYTHNPTNGDGCAFVWLDDGPVARLVCGLGNAQDWAVLKTEPFRSAWPQGLDPSGDRWRNPALFAWSDRDGDGRPQPGEVRIIKAAASGVTVLDDLSFVVARQEGRAVRFAATGFTDRGVPRYDLDSPEVLAGGAQNPPSSGGNQALTEPGGWTIHTNAPEPFSPFGLGGTFRGQPRWSYPSPWPGLHASHEAAVPDRPGMVVGHTRLLGGWIRPGGEGGPMFCINGNMGNMYLLTADGLFVSTLFHDIRLRPNWAMPTATRGMEVGGVSLHDENFWPSITQAADGKVYLVDGARTSLVRVEGLETIRRIAGQPLQVTGEDLARARDWFAQAEAKRQAARGGGVLRVPIRAAAPRVDGSLDDWPADTQWAVIDRRGTRANFNSDSKPYDAAAAACVVGDRLFAAWRTTEKDLLVNSGDTPQALFKTGGCLDLMLATDSQAKPDRAEPVAGDVRLLVTLVKGQPRAVLYAARRGQGSSSPVRFSSPWRTITFDAVEDVTAHVALATDRQGCFEISVPVAVLGWQPKPGQAYRADLGLLRGDGSQTTQRVYWSNKATAITADVPSEAELAPRLWGQWQISGE